MRSRITACSLFGAATALQFQLSAFGIGIPDALLIMLSYLLALLAVGGLVGRPAGEDRFAQRAVAGATSARRAGIRPKLSGRARVWN